MSKVLFLNEKTIGANMAGPGIRTWELAKCLAEDDQVRIITPQESSLSWSKITFFRQSLKNLLLAIIWADVIVVPIYFLKLSWLLLARILRKKIVVDAYFVPFFEAQEKYNAQPKRAALAVNLSKKRSCFLLKIADYIVCSTERQKELWQSFLSDLGRAQDVELGLVPTGIRAELPVLKQAALRKQNLGLKQDDKLVLWSSGLWPWLDPFSAILAISLIKDEQVKLVFYGVASLDEYSKGESSLQLKPAIDLAKDLGLYNKRVFFINQRVPYQHIANYLLDADVALNLHYNNKETYYAYRTRVLDYIWAGLPIVTTEGDVLSEKIKERALGSVVKYQDGQEIAAAIEKLLSDKGYYDQCCLNMKQFAMSQSWSNVAQPLKQYCLKPTMAYPKRFLSLLGACFSFYCWGLYYLLNCKLRFKC